MLTLYRGSWHPTTVGIQTHFFCVRILRACLSSSVTLTRILVLDWMCLGLLSKIVYYVRPPSWSYAYSSWLILYDSMNIIPKTLTPDWPIADDIPANPLHNHDIVSVYFNHFHCMTICDKLSRHLSMLTYIYLNVDECWLTSSMP